MEVEQEVLCSECHACNPEQSSLRQWQPPAKKGEEISHTLYQLNSSPCDSSKKFLSGFKTAQW
jgi:hypothetical protein